MAAAVGQDFTTYQGDDIAPVFTVRNAAGTVVDLTGIQEITWQAARDVAGMASPVISKTKTGGQITVPTPANGQFIVEIDASDTLPLTNYYLHRAVIRDSNGKTITVTLGRMQVGIGPAWTYSGDPSASTRDAIRFAIQDTVEASPLFMDAEIDYALSKFPNWLLAGAQLCRQLAAKFAGQVTNKRVGDLSLTYKDKAQQYLALADELQGAGETEGVTLYAGGTSKSDMAAVAANQDRAFQPFALRQFDIPGSADAAQNPEDCD